jgi:hypothetical protein
MKRSVGQKTPERENADRDMKWQDKTLDIKKSINDTRKGFERRFLH